MKKNLSAPPVRVRRVLVVDDDPTTRLLVSHHLKKQGYQVVVAGAPTEARQVLAEEGTQSFDCVVTDYLMPGETGLELLEWLKAADSTIAAVMATAVGERNLIQESLRGGVCDFLDKPIQISALLAAVSTAVETSLRRRHLRETESSVEEVGRLQQFMLGINPESLPVPVEVCWHPRHAAGGDLVNVFPLGPDKLLVLVADVSGHDLKAAFISAFFQGIVRGMVEKNTPILEVFHYFNQFLIREWSRTQAPDGRAGDVAASICTCAFLIDLSQHRLTVWNNGFPIPVHVDSAGRSTFCSPSATFPLGWFDDSPTGEQAIALEEAGSVYAWTDGVDDMAASLGVAPLALAQQLLQAKRDGAVPTWLNACTDDILLVRIGLEGRNGPGPEVRPLLVQRYVHGEHAQIDQLQAVWDRSLALALPELSADTRGDLLLCAREAAINAIKYGCASQPDAACVFAIHYFPEDQRVRVLVSDPGPGHDFDWASYAARASVELLEEHRGLALMHQLPDRTRTEQRGAVVSMEFRVAAVEPAPLQP